ncbi:hypothetical protein [Sulfitobacter pacificus]|uniref:Uncharacterized protein n=1 Tax=Sulfitobacter pacificus TaxID=1499314 RepID=A0ABQ5VFP4_9RHOB|nr:hypothetical protein [Sulfitobacter pacificus]GLQ25784.1 hypothetical protein GCM10007927_05870 [Sulfitobacter pacificus]
MSHINLQFEDFPVIDNARSVTWAPILCHPKDASWERFVVGIIAKDADGFHVEVANRLARLGCLYDERAMPLMLSVEIAIDWLDQNLSDGISSLSDLNFPVDGLAIGECQTSVGLSAKDTATLWMASLSSFYEKAEKHEPSTAGDVIAIASNKIERRLERLPVQVLGVVERRHSNLLGYFHEDVRNRREKRARANARIKIDYDGMKLSANIDRFNVDQPTATVGMLKQRMWDLAVQREKLEPASRDTKSFEMLVDFPQHRYLDKPRRSIERIQEHLRELTAQADREQIMLRTLAGAEQIGEHIVRRETAEL